MMSPGKGDLESVMVCNGVIWHRRSNRIAWDALGLLPGMLNKRNPESALQQLHKGYRRGGG